MRWQFTPYTFPLFIGAALMALLTIIVWQRSGTKWRKLGQAGERQIMVGTRSFLLLLSAATIWMLTYAFEMASLDLEMKILWAKAEYIGIATTPLAWLAFALEYSGREHLLTRRNLGWLSLLPIITITMAWTSDYHTWLWTTKTMDQTLGFSVLVTQHGPYFFLYVAFAYAYLLVGTVLLVQTLRRSPHLYRSQIIAILVSALLPWFANAMYISGLAYFYLLDLTPFGFALSCLVIFLGVMRFRLLDLTPVARDAVIENLREGVILLNLNSQFVDLNPAAREILGITSSVIGQPVSSVIPAWPESLRSDQEIRLEITLSKNENMEGVARGAKGIYELRISPLISRIGRFSGWIAFISDISARKQFEENLRGQQQLALRRSQQLEIVAQIARAALSIRTLENLLDEAVRLISERFGFYHAGIFLLDDNHEYAVLRAASSEGGKRMLARNHKLLIGQVGIVGYVAARKLPRVAHDVGVDSVFFNNPDLPHTRSEAALPLLIQVKEAVGRPGESETTGFNSQRNLIQSSAVIGVLDVQSTQPAIFSDEDISILQILADQLALAIENARLLAASQKALNELSAFYGTHIRQDWYQRLGKSGMTFHYDAHSGTVKNLPVADLEPPLSSEVEILETPVILRGQRLGVLRLRRQKSVGAWTSGEKALVNETVNQMALAIENARLLLETQDRAARQSLLNQVSAGFSRSLDVESVLRSAVFELGQLPAVIEAAVHIGPVGRGTRGPEDERPLTSLVSNLPRLPKTGPLRGNGQSVVPRDSAALPPAPTDTPPTSIQLPPGAPPDPATDSGQSNSDKNGTKSNGRKPHEPSDG